ncbi:MAG: hypothetical protein OXN27_09800 [Candidatus Poribacteria bacterium]|nr:hypothetical protein [Candidatus Poribacteria bacterium]
MMRIIGYALILTMLVFGTFDAAAEILLQEDFEGDLDLTTKWRTNTPKFVYPKDGILYLDQGKSGGDYVSLRSAQHFNDIIIYYEWFIIEWSGQGDGGGALRQTPNGSYWMRWWGRSNVKVTTNKAGPVNAWQPFPVKGGQAQANYAQGSDRFILKAALMTQEKRVTIHISDVTDKKIQVAEWEIKDNTYKSGNISFDCWKFGIYGVDNVIVATPEHEAEIFAENFDPHGLAVQPEGKLATVWGHLKLNNW